MKKVVIKEVSGDEDLSNKEKKELKEYLSSVYDIKEDKITIN